MKVSDYIKLAAVSALIALTVYTVRRDHKHPVLVTKVSEIIVTRVVAEEAPPQEVIAIAHRKVIVDDCPTYRSQRRLRADCPAEKPVEHKAQTPWALPWSCSKVKWAANTFSKATLESMRIAGGVAPLTREQKQQAKECIEGKRS